ncbi:MAG: HEPN domain-containing protein [Lautropia sp.]|nr:HEPN domain-containing protein [Lautropia sp.]
MIQRRLTPDVLMAKADRACASARVLLELGDVDGASDRAYYAMFDAARAALLVSGRSLAPDPGRSHSGLIGAFGRLLVRDGPMLSRSVPSMMPLR